MAVFAKFGWNFSNHISFSVFLLRPLCGLNLAFVSSCMCEPYGFGCIVTISCVPSLDDRGWNLVPLSKKNDFFWKSQENYASLY
jgi:hypothetical protein